MKATDKSRDLLGLARPHKSAITHRPVIKNLEWYLFIAILIICDLALYNLAFRTAYWIRYESNWHITQYWIQPAFRLFSPEPAHHSGVHSHFRVSRTVQSEEFSRWNSRIFPGFFCHDCSNVHQHLRWISIPR